jgi:hypothetical protein
MLWTDWLTDFMEQCPYWEANTYSVKKFPTFYVTGSFITVFTRARHLSLSWARWIHSISPRPVSLRYILLWFSHLRLCPLSFSDQNFVFISHLSLVLYDPPIPSSLMGSSLIIIVESYKLRNFSLCSFIQPPAPSSPELFVLWVHYNRYFTRCSNQILSLFQTRLVVQRIGPWHEI